jgi:hypothetical protein
MLGATDVRVKLSKLSRRITMEKTLLVMLALFLAAGAASASTTQKWTAGWNNFSEPLNYTKSDIKWSVASATRKLTVTYTLVGAIPGKLYQVDLAIFCSTFPSTFGQFPVQALEAGNNCQSITRQGVTASAVYVEVGVVTTDIDGDGSIAVVVGPVAAGICDVEFRALDGAGCDLTGGAGNGSDCDADFQSPGPTFGDTTTITIP